MNEMGLGRTSRLCFALLVTMVMAELASGLLSGPAFLRRRRRQALQWSCSGEHVGCVYVATCNTNLPILGVSCTLDEEPYHQHCNESLVVSVDLSGDEGRPNHLLRLSVRAEFLGGFATLPYYFPFRKKEGCESSEPTTRPTTAVSPTSQTSPTTRTPPTTSAPPTTAAPPTTRTPPTTSAPPTTITPPTTAAPPTTPATMSPPTMPTTSAGGRCFPRSTESEVIFTCIPTAGSPPISIILYRINSGRQNVGAASGFNVPLSQLQPGQNLVQVLFLFPGQLRSTQNITLQRTVPLQVGCQYREESEVMGEDLLISCSTNGSSQSISSISYTVNGGEPQTSSSVAGVTVPGDELEVGENMVVVTVTGEDGETTRQATITIQRRIPEVLCVGNYDLEGKSYNISCTSNLLPTTTECSLNGRPHPCNPGTSLLFSFLAPSNRLPSLNFHWWTDFKIVLTYNDYIVVICVRKWLVYSSYPYGSPEVLFCPPEASSDSVSFSCPPVVQRYTYSVNSGPQLTSLTGPSFTLTDNVLEDGENTVVVQATGLSGGTADAEYSVLRNTATVSHSPIDFHVTCGAQRAANNRVEVRCAKLDESGPPITAISYSMNGGSPIRAPSVSEFTLDSRELTEEVNTIDLSLTSAGGLTADTSVEIASPLRMMCSSQSVDCGIEFSCSINRRHDSTLLQCYLDNVLQESCDRVSLLQFSDLDDGHHSYTVVASDIYGFSASNQLSFSTENTLSLMCRGILKLGSSTYSVSCDSDQRLDYTDCLLRGEPVPCSLDFDVSSLPPGNHSLTMTVVNECGQRSAVSFDVEIPEMVGVCEIDTDDFDDIVDWSCTANFPGVSLICLFNGVPLEDCLCELNSEIGTAKYPDGEYSLELILNSQDGRSKNFTHMFRVETLTAISSSAIEPLDFECFSQTNNVSVVVQARANKEVNLHCLLDGFPQQTCGPSNMVLFRDVSQGLHTFTIIAEDLDGLVDKCDVHFEEDLDIACRGAYNPSQDVVHLACDSTRPLANTACDLDGRETIQCPTPYDVPVQDFVDGLYRLRVEAEDEFGNTDSQELTFSPPPPTATFVGCES